MYITMNDDTEINLAYMEYWADRSLFYVSKLLSDQLEPGDQYDKIKTIQD